MIKKNWKTSQEIFQFVFKKPFDFSLQCIKNGQQLPVL